MNSNSQQAPKDYSKEWKTIDRFIEKGQPASALDEVKKIYSLAKKEKQDAQIIKVLVYMTTLQQELREENETLSITELEKEIPLLKEPARSILQSLIATNYWNYFQNNRWEIYSRTATANFKKDDVATWSAMDFHKRITALYLASLNNKTQLQAGSLQSYEAILIKGNTRQLRPTLYDLLVHRALEYFKNNEKDIAKPAYAFEINSASAFAPATDFIHQNFETPDSLSLQHKALLLYQQLIAFHLQDEKPDALIDLDLDRITFVRSHATSPQKEEFYYNAITHVANQYGNLPAAAQAWYLLAAYHSSKGESYAPFADTTHRFAKLKAKQIAEKIITQKDSSEGKTNAHNLLSALNQSTFSFKMEKVNIPQQPFRVYVNYKNIDKLYFRIIKSSEQIKGLIETTYGENLWSQLVALKALNTWEQPMPDTKDLQTHSAEIKINALPVGEYLLLASNRMNFKAGTSELGVRSFYVSNISYVNNDKNYFVLNRETGKPIADAAVSIWKKEYDYTTSQDKKKGIGNYTTDKNGHFKMVLPANNRSADYLQIEIKAGKDWLLMNEYDYVSYSNEKKKISTPITEGFLFADRSLYRPGQTIYFKGIVLDRNIAEKTNRVKANFETIVYLQNPNNETVDSINVKTNEYGSFNGKLILPSSGINGQFRLYTNTEKANLYFNVEEYKRPKFYVDFEPIKGSYQINDKIQVIGTARAYAANNIDGAFVKYRVVREPRFLYPWLFWRSWQPPVDPMEIAHGELKTNTDGKFEINFTAIPDLSIDKKTDPVFDYKIYADITDINGETRSGEQSVSVSYKSLLINANIPTTAYAAQLDTVTIRTENMNGNFEPAKLTVTLYKLKEEKRLIRQRFWERPDQFVMAKEEYISHFPYDEYANETDYRQWEKDSKLYQKTNTATESGKWSLAAASPYPSGKYLLEINTTDKNGQPVKDLRYIDILETNNKQLNYPMYSWHNEAKAIEPGETTTVSIGTTANDLFIVQKIDKQDSDAAFPFSFFTLNNQIKNIDFAATETDRGNYGVTWLFVKHNRMYQLNQTIVVPWTNKELNITYTSFRDKTLPGSQEKWSIKLSGNKKEKIAAEMLGSMYDASLDQFHSHNWYLPPVWSHYNANHSWSQNKNFEPISSQHFNPVIGSYLSYLKRYDQFFFNNQQGFATNRYYKKQRFFSSNATNERALESAAPVKAMAEEKDIKSEEPISYDASVQADGVKEESETKNQTTQTSPLQIRKNFNETAFFLPALNTDADGNIEFSFTLPEALTKWKFQALAHTKEAAFGYSSKEIITQKELMVQPNATRFLRQGDQMEFNTKLVNLSDKELTGEASLLIFDAISNEPIDALFKSAIPNQVFQVAAGQSIALKFPVEIPYNFNQPIIWRIVARAGQYADGEENTLPVLTNRMLVTETLPIWLRENTTKTFKFDKLLNSGNSETLQHHALTIEYTSNPAWYAVQALPYLVEYPYECAEQTWNKYYANALASHIANSSPRIRQIFSKWSEASSKDGALVSALQKNEELKALLLEETPWVMQAKNETEQKKNIALLFDMVKMSEQLNNSLNKLIQLQSSNGGFVWFKGGPDDRYITQYILAGIGHLKKLNIYTKNNLTPLNEIVQNAIPYLDRKIKEDYDNLVKYKTDLTKYQPGHTVIQYLYLRSFFSENAIPASVAKAYTYFKKRAQATWVKQNKYMQAMTALALHRSQDRTTSAAIIKSLKETAIRHQELGMYWKELANRSGWFWHQAPIETQALLIETFSEITGDKKAVDDLKTWLLKNKQTNNWETTTATAEACYALLLQGSDWLNNEPEVTIKLGNTTVSSATNASEAGTGYFKQSISASNIAPAMGNIAVSIKKQSEETSSSWGGVYWQYFEDLDKITSAETPLKLNKKLFVEKNTDHGPTLSPINDGNIIKIGDKITVRIELRVDRDMEYVHMKDMRAAALEPVNVLSDYKWQGRLSYYETTKDASTNFFFSYLQKGTYVFEYSLFATHSGNFSNGITSIQCMYAPEFSSHSEGFRINIE